MEERVHKGLLIKDYLGHYNRKILKRRFRGVDITDTISEAERFLSQFQYWIFAIQPYAEIPDIVKGNVRLISLAREGGSKICIVTRQKDYELSEIGLTGKDYDLIYRVTGESRLAERLINFFIDNQEKLLFEGTREFLDKLKH
jgi:hypothetical protein